MANYRLTEDARSDLISIHQFGVRRFGEAQADRYFWQLSEHLDAVAEEPKRFPKAEGVREGYRKSVFGAHSVYFRIYDGFVEIVAILRSQNVLPRL